MGGEGQHKDGGVDGGCCRIAREHQLSVVIYTAKNIMTLDASVVSSHRTTRLLLDKRPHEPGRQLEGALLSALVAVSSYLRLGGADCRTTRPDSMP